MNSSINIKDESEYYRVKYSKLKRKLKTLVFENESYRDELQRCQRKLLKLNRDKSFLLDRLLLYETAVNSSDSESTEDSDTELDTKHARRKIDTGAERSPVKRKKQIIKNKSQASRAQVSRAFSDSGHMTPEEVERHLETRTAVRRRDLVPERAPLTVPRQLFSTEDAEEGRESAGTASNVEEEGLVIDFPE
ncbi:INO80 complex subunit E [Amphibalanus amphitrite]|uniref:INO80 complex subunit E n=1 Tax=Amphibalanus amphitrite TaxID=1232801 RepID=A0A6A4WUJ8_AMPAM|nr:transforming growth factor beta regulator 1-like isoform X1 [Amphibalanus amphitrite]KAF0309663.1 INO80 complex subunit E [Amphibalanus amphitrite]